MPAESGIEVIGLRDMQRAFARADRDLSKELRTRLRKVAQPVARDAEKRDVAEIRNIGRKWSKMRVGVTRSLVYVAPRQRGLSGRSPLRRPNLAPLLMDRAMQPALDANTPRIVHELEDMLDDVGKDWARG